ncbi:DNA primase [Clostridium puniceum]|uniref:DNA primase n=1 Tax=Clostridium puniceum TaxID=29367 RepID=A0A1S8TCW1_9CLOT|nr:VapE domain-containing protein [Clostridium puniceum]OOM75459.1 DNA primase [Clostridium puniceum]
MTKEEFKNIDLKNLIESETGQRFDGNNKMLSPFVSEKTPSFSIYFNRKNNKWMFKDFSSGEGGDCIDFYMKYKNVRYIDACKYLNIEPNEEYGRLMTLVEKVEIAIKQLNFKDSNDNPLKHIHTYIFVDQYNKPIYFEAKFKDIANKSTSRFLSINNDGNVIPKREADAVPYNFYTLLDGLKNNKDIFIVEGAKDADTLIHFGYLATSFKGVTEFDYSIFKDAIVYCCPDTGHPGEKYKDDLYYKLKDYAKEFNVIYPKGWNKFPSNFDITDYFQSGGTLNDFKAALIDKWDYIKNRNFKYVTKEGFPKKIWENFQRICELNHITIRYNELSKKLEFEGNIFSLKNNSVACMEDLYSLCVKFNFNISKSNLRDFVFRVSQANSYNPARDYFEECYKNWNHEEGYIRQLADTIITSDDYDNNFKLLLLKKWLIGTANISFNDGTQNMNGILVIQGNQGLGKTRWIKTLLPNSQWIDTDKLINPKKVDDVIDVTSALIVELGELKTSLKKDTVDALKMFFTRTKDRYRRPYGTNAEEYPRVTSFYATINNNEFLEDNTGNRRYWCINVTNIIVDHNIDISQLWGEIMHLLKDKKEPHWLNKEEEQQLYIVNSNFEVKTEADSRVMDNLNWSAPNEYWLYKTFTQVCNELDIKPNTESRNTLMKLGAIPPPNNKTFRANGASKRWWLVPPVNFSIEDDDSIEIADIKPKEIQQKILI